MSDKKELGRSWFYLSKKKRKDLRFLTIIIGAIRLQDTEATDLVQRKEIIRQVVEMIDGFRRQWISLGRARKLTGYTHRGEIEIDIKRDLVPGSHCFETLETLGCDVSPLGDRERILIVHVHLVIDGADVVTDTDQDGEKWADQLRRTLKGAWPGVRRTQVKSLYANQSVSTAVRKLYGYCTKRRYEYSAGGYGDETTRYVAPYEFYWMRLLVRIYKDAGTEFRSKR